MRRNILFAPMAALAALLAHAGPDSAAAQTRTTLDIHWHENGATRCPNSP